jgi:hypothetical protein
MNSPRPNPPRFLDALRGLALFFSLLLPLASTWGTPAHAAPGQGSDESPRLPRKRMQLPKSLREEDELELADGRRIKAARLREFGDRLQAFAEEKGIDLQDGKATEIELPLHPEQKKRVDQSDEGFQGRLQKLREAKAAGWREKIRKRLARFDVERPPFRTLRRLRETPDSSSVEPRSERRK